MRKMILLFSHTLTKAQERDAKERFDIEEFIALPNTLQELWSNIPPELEELEEYLEPIRSFLVENMEIDDIALVQGDFGATCAIASFVKSIGGVATYATTKRNVVEKKVHGKIVKTSVFEHIRFRLF